MDIIPVTYRTACDFVKQHHRHHVPPQGHKFSIGLSDRGVLVGVAMVGRPVSRNRDDGITAEVTRLCTNGTQNACSMLYAAAWRTAKAMGYKRIITYILESESGISLKASGWHFLGISKGGQWSCKVRQSKGNFPTCAKKCYGLGIFD